MNETPRERFQDLLESFSTGMLVTAGEEGLASRPMRVAQAESDGDLWFACQRESGKVDDIKNHPKVLITFQDGGRYLSLSGAASLVTARDKIEEMWSESWRVWFPGGQSDPSLALLHVSATHGEYWDNSWLQGLSYAIRAGQAYWQGEQPEIPESMHAETSLG